MLLECIIGVKFVEKQEAIWDIMAYVGYVLDSWLVKERYLELRNLFGKLILLHWRMNDLIADMLTRIQNGIMRKKEQISIPVTKVNREILKVIKQEGMLEDFEEKEGMLVVTLKYDKGEPVITHLKKISKPGQRIYVSYKDIVPVMNGRGISIISTSEGIMSGAMSKSKKLGGELICNIW